MDPQQRLDQIAARITACPPPDAANGFDRCRHGSSWPCRLTEAAWLARGLDIAAERGRAVRAAADELVID